MSWRLAVHFPATRHSRQKVQRQHVIELKNSGSGHYSGSRCHVKLVLSDSGSMAFSAPEGDQIWGISKSRFSNDIYFERENIAELFLLCRAECSDMSFPSYRHRHFELLNDFGHLVSFTTRSQKPSPCADTAVMIFTMILVLAVFHNIFQD